jgi:hypothetical protein
VSGAANSVDQLDHDRVRGLTVIGARGRTRRARAVGGYLARLAVVVGVLAGVVFGNGVQCAYSSTSSPRPGVHHVVGHGLVLTPGGPQ